MSPSFGETSIGGPQRAFPSTCWFRFLKSREWESPDPGPFESLASAYWKPIYAYFRRRWSCSNDEAKDLTQEFFLHLLGTDFVQKADPTRGRFRAFLKVALDRFAMNERRDAGAQKRGGDRKTFQLGALPDSGESLNLPDDATGTPEEVLDRAWRSEILMRGREILEKSFAAEGKEIYFQVFREYYLGDSGEVDYDRVSQKFGIPASSVSNYLMKAKRRFRGILSDLVAETVTGSDDLKEELRFLFGDAPP